MECNRRRGPASPSSFRGRVHPSTRPRAASTTSGLVHEWTRSRVYKFSYFFAIWGSPFRANSRLIMSIT